MKKQIKRYLKENGYKIDFNNLPQGTTIKSLFEKLRNDVKNAREAMDKKKGQKKKKQNVKGVSLESVYFSFSSLQFI